MIRTAPAVLLFSVCLVASGATRAQAINCSAVPKTMPLRASVLAPVASELASPSEQLGAAGGVLAHAYDESQSVDQVLLRMRIESCKNVAAVMPAPTSVDPLDPAAYKPKTEFDNTPWRFNMNQNGRNMTADEFSAWMKSRGVRVARGAAPVAPVPTTPMIAPQGEASGQPAPQPAMPPAQAPAGSPAGTLRSDSPTPPAGNP